MIRGEADDGDSPSTVKCVDAGVNRERNDVVRSGRFRQVSGLDQSEQGMVLL
jgi:hypothetical protein